MTIKELKFLRTHGEDMDIQDPKMVPLVQYLLTENNYFKSIQQIQDETKWSRYLIKNAKEMIEIYLKEKFI